MQMDDAQARRAGAVDQGERHHSADSRAARSATAIASSPASVAGARRSAPVCTRCRSSFATCRDGDKQLLELALIENIQRENLNPVDEALAYQRLADEFALTQDQIAAAVGKDRSSVANFLRLLKLPEEVRGDLAAGALSMGHARALLALSDAAAQRQAAREVISRGLSVRETEALVKRLLAPGTGDTARRHNRPRRRRTSIPAPPKTGCASPSERRSGSSGEARAAESRSISGRKPS